MDGKGEHYTEKLLYSMNAIIYLRLEFSQGNDE